MYFITFKVNGSHFQQALELKAYFVFLNKLIGGFDSFVLIYTKHILTF